ncbi:hypothetical protein N7490_011048 [Penicillium lividum]|nr:hypothetical protein N7490_011048 [Penicillium lividum]
MVRVWVNIFLSGRESRLSDNDLLLFILTAAGSRQGTITQRPKMMRVKGTNMTSYFDSAERTIYEWGRDLESHETLPFDRRCIFPLN